jgi:hypothetical protein
MKVTQSQEEIGRGKCRKNQWVVDRPVTGGYRGQVFARGHGSARQGSAVSYKSTVLRRLSGATYSVPTYGNRVVFELAYLPLAILYTIWVNH